MSHFYQGDIELEHEFEEYIKSGGRLRNAIRERKLLWTSRVIPYRIPAYMSMYTSIISCSSMSLVWDQMCSMIPLCDSKFKQLLIKSN